MPVMDLVGELKRVSKIRQLLEPLVVLYEQSVISAGKEPFEVWLKVQQSTFYLSDDYEVFGPAHFIDGETLEAVNDAWQHFRQIERGLLEAPDAD